MFVNNSCLYNNMNCIIAPLNGRGGIYLGNLDAAQDPELLKQHSIQAVVTALDQSVQITGAQKLWIMADDCSDFPLHKYFDQAINFIESQSRRTNILIHCYAGISRSATLLAAYLMKKYNWGVNQTLRHIQSKRRIANPNPGFMRQLKEFEEKNNNSTSNSRGSVSMYFSAASASKLDVTIGVTTKTSTNTRVFGTVKYGQRPETPQTKDRLTDFNVKLEQFRHQMKVKQRLAQY